MNWPAPTFALGTKVRYTPYYREPDGPDAPQCIPWRILGRGVLQMLDASDRIHYTIQPWDLSGVWMRDRPRVVDAGQVTTWIDGEQTPDHTEGEERHA